MLKFKDMPYERPDMEAAKKELARLAAALKEADSYEAAKSVFLEKDTLKKHIETQAALAQIRQTINTRDEFYDQEVNFWNEAGPELMEYEQMWNKALLATPYRDQLTEAFGNVIFLNAELEEKSFDPSIIPQMQKENDLTLEYEKLIAGAQIPFNGETYTIAQIQPFKSDADDEVRLAAWKAEGGWYKEHQQDLDRIYDEMVALRDEMGKKLGFKDFVDLGYCRMGRNCYDRNDIDQFRAAVRDYIVPVADMVRRRQAERLGMQYPLSFADCALLFRSGNPKPAGGEEEILEAAKRFYDALSPETSEFFQTMLDYELMDLLAKEGKAGGGYCEGIFDYEVPFIFANFNGTRDDVETVTHEAGHAFAAYLNRKRVPMETVWPGMESCEVHSMSMEFFAWKAAEDFFGPDTRKFLYTHLAESLLFIPYGTMVDHFQHSVYEHPEMTPAERHAEWKRLLGIYMPWLRLDGEIPFYAEGMGWQRQSHIYEVPFYYIDYCLAQTVALGFWAMIQEDYGDAWAHYMAYTEQGGSFVFTDLLANAGLASPFEEETLRSICAKAKEWLDAYNLNGIA